MGGNTSLVAEDKHLDINDEKESDEEHNSDEDATVQRRKVLRIWHQNNLRRLETLSCRHKIESNFKDILLAINFNHPHYENIPLLRELYKPVFPHIVYCGPEKDKTKRYKIIVRKVPFKDRSYYGYQCLNQAITRNPGYNGYLYINDDMIINWWKLLYLDRNKIWTSRLPNINDANGIGSAARNDWWLRADCARRCSEAFYEIEDNVITNLEHEIYYTNTNGKKLCLNGWSDMFFIPRRLSLHFTKIAKVFFEKKVFLEAAVQTILTFLDKRQDFVLLNGIYLPEKFGFTNDFSGPGFAWQVYTRDLTFIHPYKLSNKNASTENRDLFRDILVKVSEKVVRTSCLDIIYDNKIKKKEFDWSANVKEDWSKYG